MRLPREKRPGEIAVYHCISRIVGGQFLLGQEEKHVFRARMRKLARFCQVQLITHHLMENHVHLQVRCPERVRLSNPQLLAALKGYYGPKSPQVLQFQEALESPGGSLLASLRKRYLARMGDISVYMKELKEGFTKWYNRRHERFGTLWAERFKSEIVQNDPTWLLMVAAYIDLNGVRAGKHDDPKDDPWCGYGEALAGKGDARAGLSSILPPGSWKKKQACYRLLLFGTAGRASHPGKRTLDPEQIRKVYQEGGELSLAQLLRVKVRALSEGIAFGSREFVNEVFEAHRKKYCKKRKVGARPLKGEIWEGACAMRNFKEPIR